MYHRCHHRFIHSSYLQHSGCTPLHIAARKKNLAAVMKLVNAGADVNKKDTLLGRTVLHVAVEEGCVDIVRYLLEKVRNMLNEMTSVFRDFKQS
jgi:FOG: Ankyrin repeat